MPSLYIFAVKCLFISFVHFLLEVVFLLLSFESFFIYFQYGHWFHMWFANIFSYSLHTWKNLTWSCFIILFIYYWIHFANILLRMFACKFTRDVGLYNPWVCMCFLCLLLATEQYWSHKLGCKIFFLLFSVRYCLISMLILI